MVIPKQIGRFIPDRVKRLYRSLKISLMQVSYRHAWDQYAKTVPYEAILKGSQSELDFDSSGQKTAEWLRSVIPKNLVVLDVGCGIGRVEKHLADHCREIHAVDVSPQMIKLARQRLSGKHNVFFHVVSGTELNCLTDNSFDAMFSLLVLQHLEAEDAFRYLVEFNRVLKDQGICILQFPKLCSDVYFRDFLNSVRIDSERRLIARVRCYTEEEVAFKLNKAGLEIQRLEKEGSEMIVQAKKFKSVSLSSIN